MQLLGLVVAWLPLVLAVQEAKQNVTREDIYLDKEGTLRIYRKWHNDAVGGVMATFATRALKVIKEPERGLVVKCLSLAVDLQSYAKCLKPAFTLEDYYGRKKTDQSHGAERRRIRAKRQVSRLVAANGPAVQEAATAAESPRSLKTKLVPASGQNWLSTAAARFLSIGVRKIKERIVLEQEKAGRPVDRAMRRFLDTKSSDWDWRNAYGEVSKYMQAKKWSEKYRRLMDADSISGRTADGRIVHVGNKTLADDIVEATSSAFALMTGAEVDPVNSSPRVLSPRLISYFPEEENDALSQADNILSPDLFSLYRSKDSVLSLPDLADALGSAEWMNVIMEASGAGAVINGLHEDLQNWQEENNGTVDYNYVSPENLTAIFGTENNESIAYIRDLIKSFTHLQLNDMEKEGISYMNREQIEKVYGKRYPDFVAQDEWDINAYLNLRSKRDKDRAVKTALKQYINVIGIDLDTGGIRGNNVTFASKPKLVYKESYRRRVKRQSPTNSALVLTPLENVPLIQSPSVLGPLILSPGVFVPTILSPFTLGSLILSPQVGFPLVLSPWALAAAILSPVVLGSWILNPWVLGPLVLNNLVMTPFVLSPQALSPYILSPGVMNPFILTPRVLGPVVHSNQVLSPFVLSPSHLSPLIKSDSVLTPLVLSPLTRRRRKRNAKLRRERRARRRRSN